MTLLSEFNAAKKQFEDAHGGNPVFDPDSGHELFPDGASRKFDDVLGTYYHFEPQYTNPTQLLRSRHRYVQLLLNLEKAAFTSFKNDCMKQLSWRTQWNSPIPAPPAEAATLLKAGAKRIEKLEEQLAELDREISQLPEEIARREYLDRQNQQAMANHQQAIELRSIEI